MDRTKPLYLIADGITVSRMIFSFLLLIFPQSSRTFAALYLLCGISDVLDGFAARKLHTESEKGAMLDSIADILFATVYAVRILPHLHMPFWIWIWIAGIAVVKLTGILLKSRRKHGLSVQHSFANKLTGLLAFLFPLSISVLNVKCGAALVCASATAAAIEECAENNRI